jgi:hypothetical protein
VTVSGAILEPVKRNLHPTATALPVSMENTVKKVKRCSHVDMIKYFDKEKSEDYICSIIFHQVEEYILTVSVSSY